MKIPVTFYSYFKDLTGTPETILEVPDSSTLAELMVQVFEQFPKMKEMDRSTLIAVGVEYQDRTYSLRQGDEVSLFPPVQGG
ncbi:MoaD/ThiS family protein [bacterium]|jgi:molybdopterin converting factor small subunit|nr:MoaD/ThiS family protein [Verrucomicrobiota bacterium]MDA7511376.1 MoaD/ThiS family protein [Verrucomicrobiota bacterium]MDA7645472.1 MoaD/ThiS family protein [bacterium]MDA7680289.1 MoaD/ThiS family protein [bacterium]